jgi:hypothetical protein
MGAWGALLCADSASAQVSLTPAITPIGSLFRYEYSVTNASDFELLLVDVQTLALPDAVKNTIAPAGFQISFDSGLGLVSFLPDADPDTPGTFAPGSTISGFQFDSPYAPDRAAFEALAFDDVNAQLVTFNGSTLGPTAVPEPGAIAWCLAGGAGLFLLRRRNRKSA